MIRARILQDFRAQGAQAGTRVREMVIYSGAPVYRYDFWAGQEYFLTLSMDPDHVNLKRLKNAPVLADHRRSVHNTVGVVERAWLDGKKLMAETRFHESANAESDHEDLWAKIKAGIIRNVSVEAMVMQTKDITKKGDAMKSLLAIDWSPEAVALVPVGADQNATLLSEDERNELWLPEGMYRKPELAEAGAASIPQPLMTSLLLQRRAQL